MSGDPGSTSKTWFLGEKLAWDESSSRLEFLGRLFAATRPVQPHETLPCAPPSPFSLSEGATRATQLGQYNLEDALGIGGFGAVYAARCTQTGRRVAIKFLHHRWAKAHEVVLRLFREAEAISRIGHPNIVEIYHWGWITQHVPAIVMELFEGKSLGRILEVRGRLSVEEVLEYLQPICQALSAAHRAGIIHRDIKASNVLVRREEGQTCVKLIDFGIAKLLAPDVPGLTRTGFVVGSPTAASPEQILAKPVDERTDVYGLGVLLYHLLTGALPFRDTSAEGFLAKHLGAPPPRASHVAPVSLAFDQVILRSMDKEPDHRFQSVEEFLSALREAAAEARERRGPRSNPNSLPLGLNTAREETAPAIAFFLELRSSESRIDVDDLDDDALDELQSEMDQIRADLVASQFAIPIETSTEIMGCLPLENYTIEEIVEQWQSVFGVSRAIVRRIQTSSQFRVSARIDIGTVRLRLGAGAGVGSAGAQILGVEKLAVFVSPDRNLGLWASCRRFCGQFEPLDSESVWLPVDVPGSEEPSS